jgi:hypothetical protein
MAEVKFSESRKENSWLRKRKKAAEKKATAAAVRQAKIDTEASRRLCQEVSRLSGGVCFLGFSRGKDSIVSWLFLKRYFSRVIPFHCSSVPGLEFVEKSLEYYEKHFSCDVERILSGDVSAAIANLVYQPPSDEREIDSLGFWQYDNHTVVQLLREKYNLPNAWCAYGISMNDSIDRRIYVGKCMGRNDMNRTFYPCYDWSRKMVIDTIMEAGIRLPGDYKLASRSMASVPNFRHLYRMRTVFPKDFERVKLLFPFIEAMLAKMEFRAEHQGIRV